ncbi:hypothetical protein [uncultured Nevskia sp.]|uniref:hypothetical protein n=1 Tax=uncultured Nevskia sp. TaxID=228950 RepID=UPI0025FE713A|nr:hypothetical protein [uncultured Nevskia sp.]
MILQLLDVLIGLTLVYLIFSTAASIGVELLESWLRQRGKLLERGIGEILSQIVDGPDEDKEAEATTKTTKMLKKLYESPFIYSLYEGKYISGNNKLPSAIPAARFAGALIALADEDEKFRKAANTMLKVAGLKLGDDDAKVRAALAAYFEESMERVTGWYRRHVQLVLLAIGAVLAIALNADTLNIVRTLSQDDALRAKIVATAVGVQGEGQAPAPICKEATADCERQLAQQVGSQLALASNLGLPLGWNLGGTGIGLPTCVPAVPEQSCKPARAFASDALFVITKILGLALTALATTLGAPFWFDLLNRLIQTRSVAAQAREAVDEITTRKRSATKSELEPESERAAAANDDGSSDPDPDPAPKPRTTRTPRRRRSSPRPPRTPAA